MISIANFIRDLIESYVRTIIDLLKIEAAGLPAARLADSDSLQVGDWVLVHAGYAITVLDEKEAVGQRLRAAFDVALHLQQLMPAADQDPQLGGLFVRDPGGVGFADAVKFPARIGVFVLVAEDLDAVFIGAEHLTIRCPGFP